MRQPPPKKKGIVGIPDLMKCLATKHQSSVTIATVYDLTRIFSDEVRSVSVHMRKYSGGKLGVVFFYIGKNLLIFGGQGSKQISVIHL